MTTEQAVAPDDLLEVICCNCKAGCSSNRCSCRYHGIHCVVACGNCHGEGCENAEACIVDEEDSDVDCDEGQLHDLIFDEDID